MANITKINLKGIEYNLSDSEARNLIAQLQESTYSKAEVDSLVSTIDDKIDGIDLAAYETKEGAASKYQPKGDYLTEHQDISELATKQEVADAVAGVDVSDQLKDYATKTSVDNAFNEISELGDRISTLSNKTEEKTTALEIDITALKQIDHSQYLTEHQDISGKVDKVDGKGLSTNDYSDADKAKVDAAPTFWVGTQAEYDAIAVKDNKTFYYITEE